MEAAQEIISRYNREGPNGSGGDSQKVIQHLMRGLVEADHELHETERRAQRRREKEPRGRDSNRESSLSNVSAGARDARAGSRERDQSRREKERDIIREREQDRLERESKDRERRLLERLKQDRDELRVTPTKIAPALTGGRNLSPGKTSGAGSRHTTPPGKRSSGSPAAAASSVTNANRHGSPPPFVVRHTESDPVTRRASPGSQHHVIPTTPTADRSDRQRAASPSTSYPLASGSAVLRVSRAAPAGASGTYGPLPAATSSSSPHHSSQIPRRSGSASGSGK